MQKRKYTFKLYPNALQESILIEHLRLHQQLYNAALQERIDCYQKTGQTIQYNDQQASLTQIRQEFDQYRNIPVYFCRMTLRRLDKAFKAFFQRVKKGQTPGFPRFKSINRFHSFEMCSHGRGWRFYPDDGWKHGKLHIKGIGNIRARGKARTGGTIKTSQVIHRHGQWWLSVTVECEPTREATHTKAAGLDWGVEYMASITDEHGHTEVIENPRYYRTSKAHILKLEQDVSSRKRGTIAWRTACKKLSKAKARLARKRKDDHHKLSAKIAEQYALICTEKLTIKNMTASAKGTKDTPGKNVRQKAGLNREILDTAPAMLLAMIRYKVEETGGEFVEAPTRTLKPSQRCPKCWTIKKKKLSERQHECEPCGLSMPRDTASAWVNVLWALGLGREPATDA
jgi:putative transposase